jgi:hypothetical protein
MEVVTELLCGLDLGQQADPTALILLECTRTVVYPKPSGQGWTFRNLDGSDPVQYAFDGATFTQQPSHWRPMPKREPAQYTVRTIHEYPLKTPYVAIVEDVQRMVAHLGREQRLTLFVDQTGVGRPVCELFERALGGIVMPVTITSGHSVSREGGAYHVPKKDLIGAVQLVLEQQRIRFPKLSLNARKLVKELQNYEYRITAHANIVYNPRQDSVHDDLILALSMPIWWSERQGGSLGILL